MTDAIYTYAMDLEGQTVGHGDCFLAAFSDRPCAGRMQKAHLIRQQTIRRELRWRNDGEDVAATLWDERVWRAACYRHHTMLDQARTLRIPRSAIPAETEAYAGEFGLGWWLDRTYGLREDVAA
jgi:hypothetical protein